MFSTNIQCENCVKAVKPCLDQEPAIDSWDVSLDTQEKILEVHGNSLKPEQVVKAVSKAGYEAKQLS